MFEMLGKVGRVKIKVPLLLLLVKLETVAVDSSITSTTFASLRVVEFKEEKYNIFLSLKKINNKNEINLPFCNENTISEFN